jgi:eukaryotic-like serine/threonine-protein kinase
METQDRFPVLQVGVLLLGLALLLLLLLRPVTTVPIGITRENVAQIEQVARLGNGDVFVAAWSPDGRTIALAGTVGIWLYDAEQPQAMPTLIEDQAGSVFDVAFHPDGGLLAASNSNGTIYLWDTHTQTLVSRLEGHENVATNILFTPDGRYLISTDAVYENATTRLWDIETGEQMLRLAHDEEVEAVAVSADGRLLATTHWNEVQIRSLPDGERLATLEPQWLHSRSRMAFSLDDSLFVVGSGNPTVFPGGTVWRIDPDDSFTPVDLSSDLPTAMTVYLESTGEAFVEQRPVLASDVLAEIWDLQQRGSLFETHDSTMQPDPTGRLVLLKRFNQVELWRADGPSLEAVLHRDIEALHQVEMAGETIIATSIDSAQIWDGTRGQHTALNLQNTGGALIRAFELNGKLLGFLVEWTGGVRLINLTTGNVEQTFAGRSFQEAYVFSRDNRYLATNTQDGFTTIWNLATGQIVSQFAPDNRELMYGALAFSPDTSLLAATIFDFDCDCTRVMLWETATGELVRELGTFERHIFAARFTDRGDRLIVSGGGRTEQGRGDRVKIWDVTTGEEVIRLDVSSLLVMALDVSRDGQLVVGLAHGEVWMWNMNTAAEQGPLLTLSSRGNFSEKYISTTFNPQGDLLVVGTSWGNLLFFDTATGEEVYAMRGHAGRIEDLHFTDNGEMLLSTGSDGTVRLWRTDGRQVVQTVSDEPIVLPTIAVTMTPTPGPQPTITTTPVPAFDS